MTPFSLLVKPVGARCNLACDYCFYLGKASLYPNGPAKMSDAVLERMIESYLSLPFDSFSIAFQGGEPMLAARLLADDMPTEVESIFRAAGFDLFPGGKLGPGKYDMTSACSCPDYANPCKHVAAVMLLTCSGIYKQSSGRDSGFWLFTSF